MSNTTTRLGLILSVLYAGWIALFGRITTLRNDILEYGNGNGSSRQAEYPLSSANRQENFKDYVKTTFTKLPSQTKSSITTSSNDKANIHTPTNDSNGMPKVLVIYFPQYHRDPINEKNWGENFTDWVSLQKSPAKNREGYPIPRPLDEEFEKGLGYYNLEDTAPRQRQGELAKQYGIDGFIYHTYWFYDKSHPGPNLEKPLMNMLRDGHPDRPFMLNWCAVKWVNVWMGKAIFQTIPTNKNRAITLQEQFFEPTVDEIREHYNWLSQFFHHPNYIRVANNTQPTLMLYNFDKLAVPILKQLRQFAIEDGFESLYLIVGRSGPPTGGLYDTSHIQGRDRDIFEAQQQTAESLPVYTVYGKNATFVDFITTENVVLKRRPNMQAPAVSMKQNKTTSIEVVFNQSFTYPYPLEYINRPFQVPQWCRDRTTYNPPRFIPESTGVVTVFDNTPRREFRTSKMYNQGPPQEVVAKFEKNFYAALYYQKCCVGDGTTFDTDESGNGTGDKGKPKSALPMDERFVAINAMNEWAEGMSIEPSDVYQYGFLETISRVKEKVQAEPC